MAKKTIGQVVEGILSKIEDKSAKYQETLEKKHEQLIGLQVELQEAEDSLKMLHKMKLLEQVSEGTYEDQKRFVDELKLKIEEVETEMSLIEVYKKEDVEAELAEIQKVKPEFNAEQNKKLSKLKFEMQQAKLEYLQKMIEVRKEYLITVSPESKFQTLLVKMGKQPANYLSGAYEGIGFTGTGNGFTTTNLFVDQHTVHQALGFGNLPSDTVIVVENGKKAGYLK